MAKRVIAGYYGSDIGHILEFKKIKRYATMALSRRDVNPIERFAQLLESRLDTVVFNLKWGATMRDARILVSHGNIKLNGVKTTCGGVAVNPGDCVELVAKAHNKKSVALAAEIPYRNVPEFYEIDGYSAKISKVPALSEIESKLPFKADFARTVEFCRRKGA